MLRHLVRLFLVLTASALAWNGLRAAAEPAFVGPLTAATIDGPPRKETSGLALSRRTPGIIWTHDDSKGSPQLFADDLGTGKRRGALRVGGFSNEDWEDLAAYEHDGKAWLVVGDVGDNDARRKTVRLLVLEEPAGDRLRSDGVVEVAPTYTLRFRYPDGPRDCEGIAVDAAEGAVYLITKREKTPRLYRVPLANPGDRVVEAQFVTEVPGVAGGPRPDSLLKRLAGPRFHWPTALDFAPDGRTAVVLTYGEPLVFPRAAGEAWSAAFQRAPIRLGFHGFPQAEAVGFSLDGGTIYVASEDTNALLRYEQQGR
jgi:hypothetical protein